LYYNTTDNFKAPESVVSPNGTFSGRLSFKKFHTMQKVTNNDQKSHLN